MDLKSSSLEVSAHKASAYLNLVFRNLKVQGLSSLLRLSLSRPSSPSPLLAANALIVALSLLAATTAYGQLANDQRAEKAATRIDLTVSTIQLAGRTRATFTAQVSSAAAASVAGSHSAFVPTGSVSFINLEQSVGSALLDPSGKATLTVAALPAGLQKITAVYEGDAKSQSATSTAASVNSEASGAQAFTLSANPTALKVMAGTNATTVITATPENGFNQSVSLSCSGVPYVSVTCSFSPSPVTPGAITAAAPNGTPAISTLTIATLAPSASLQQPGSKSGSDTVYALVFPGILALLGLGLARKGSVYGKFAATARMMGLLALLAAGSLGLGACSQRYRYFHRAPAGNPGTPPGAYTVVISGITGAGSNLATGAINVTLTVTAD